MPIRTEIQEESVFGKRSWYEKNGLPKVSPLFPLFSERKRGRIEDRIPAQNQPVFIGAQARSALPRVQGLVFHPVIISVSSEVAAATAEPFGVLLSALPLSTARDCAPWVPLSPTELTASGRCRLPHPDCFVVCL